ncbi:MAG TPA: histidine kinase dimerization/phospho-acceptor domain-containing protein [Candidatus Angelobacter sp.]|jgi:nitrogen-specific signal transduction histidine kinase|nr:histidine kinase dimerization/phospho-acceptor domain-containing protein [Candidatus Angelobacter sp.]
MIFTTLLSIPLQQILRNPLVIRMALGVAIFLCAFLLAAILIRKVKQDITAETSPAALPKEGSSAFGFAAYNGVIHQLREKEKNLQRLLETEQQRSASAEIIHEAMLANLSSGVIYLDWMGGVRQANRAARSLLGYASPLMFNLRDLFRTVTQVRWPDGTETNSANTLISALQQSIRDGTPFTKVEIEYRTPAGQKRTLAVSAFPVTEKSAPANTAKDKEALGSCCLVEDLTQITEIARQMHVSENLASMGEISAGLVRDFKNSLETIAGHAQTLSTTNDGEETRQLAEKIKREAESLSKVVAEFLEFASPSKN